MLRHRHGMTLFFLTHLWGKMMMNKKHAKPSLLCVLLQPTTTYITKEK